MSQGRPPIWDDPEEFEKAVDQYFDNTEINHTWTGLAIHLGFESRQSLEDYKKKDGFSYPIKKALLKIERKYEEAMMKQPAGAIFALKNFGWKDKQEIDQNTNHSGGITISWEEPPIQDTPNKGSD